MKNSKKNVLISLFVLGLGTIATAQGEVNKQQTETKKSKSSMNVSAPANQKAKERKPDKIGASVFYVKNDKPISKEEYFNDLSKPKNKTTK